MSSESILGLIGVAVGVSLAFIGDEIRWRRNRKQRNYQLSVEAVTTVIAAWQGIEAVRLHASEGFRREPITDNEREAFFAQFKDGVIQWLLAISSAKLAPLSDDAKSHLEAADVGALGMSMGQGNFDQLDRSREPVQHALEQLVSSVRLMAP